MPQIKKRIYASAFLLAAVLAFNIFCYFKINFNSNQSSRLENALIQVSNLQGQSQEISQDILVLTIHQSFSPEIYSRHEKELTLACIESKKNFAALNQIINDDFFPPAPSTTELRKFFSRITDNFNKLTQKANDVLSSPQKFMNNYDFANEVRKNESGLRSQLPLFAQAIQNIDSKVEHQVSNLNTAIILSLLVTLFLVALLLITPTIKLNIKGDQQLQETLHEVKNSENLLRTVLDSSPDFIFILDKNQKYQMVNKTLSDAMDLKPADFIGKDDLELGLSSDMILGNLEKGFKGLWNDNKEVLETGAIKYIPEESLHLNGKTRIVDMTKAPVTNAEGEVWGLLGFAKDITQRIDAQKKMRESEKKYRYLFDINPLAMWIYDPESLKFLEANEMAAHQYGYTMEEFLNMSILDMQSSSERNRLKELIKGIHREDHHLYVRGKWINVKKDGQQLFVDIISHSIDYNGSKAVLVLANDVTKEVELQNLLVQEKINHQNVIAKAAIDVQEKERNQMGKELHDNVNQILTSAKLFLESAENGNAEKHRRTGIELIVSAISEIRKLSKSFVPPSLNGSGLVISINDLMENIQETGAIKTKFTNDISDEHRIDKGLKLTIYRIIQEQTTNILKYAEASQLEIELSENKNQLRLVITDNGKGFDVNQHRSGVGISNMMNRAEIYQGKLFLDSSPGNGCILSVDFKLD
jgi:PAS domain S-box-containing protein